MRLSPTNNALKGCRLLFGKPVSFGELEQNTLSLLVNNWHRLAFRAHPTCPITESYCVEGMSNFRVSTKKWRYGRIALVCDYCSKQRTRGCTVGTDLLSPAVPLTVVRSLKLSDGGNMWHKKKFLFANWTHNFFIKSIVFLNMFRALLCSSSGGLNCIYA